MLMGSAKTGQLSTGRSASRNKSDAKRALSVLSPVHRRAITGSAPRTPSSVVMTEAPKRLKNMAEDDETGTFIPTGTASVQRDGEKDMRDRAAVLKHQSSDHNPSALSCTAVTIWS